MRHGMRKITIVLLSWWFLYTPHTKTQKIGPFATSNPCTTARNEIATTAVFLAELSPCFSDGYGNEDQK